MIGVKLVKEEAVGEMDGRVQTLIEIRRSTHEVEDGDFVSWAPISIPLIFAAAIRNVRTEVGVVGNSLANLTKELAVLIFNKDIPLSCAVEGSTASKPSSLGRIGI